MINARHKQTGSIKNAKLSVSKISSNPQKTPKVFSNPSKKKEYENFIGKIRKWIECFLARIGKRGRDRIIVRISKKSCKVDKGMLLFYETMENSQITKTCLLNIDILAAFVDSGFSPINLVITSPPYNLDVEYDTHKDGGSYKNYLKWCEQWISKLYTLMADDGRLCINIPFKITPPQDKTSNYPIAADYTTICQRVGFKFFNSIVWDKGIIPSKTCWGSRESASSPFVRDPAECILVFYKKQWKRLDSDPGCKNSTIGKDFYKWTTNVWQFAAEKKNNVGGHPAPFPMELPTRCIKLFSYKNDIVCDPFMGSGTTGEAAVRLGRRFIGIELSKKYYDFAQERIENAVFQKVNWDATFLNDEEEQ